MSTYVIRQFYVVEVLVEADSAEEAKDYAMDYEYTVEAQYAKYPGGPEIMPTDIDDEVILVEVQS